MKRTQLRQVLAAPAGFFGLPNTVHPVCRRHVFGRSIVGGGIDGNPVPNIPHCCTVSLVVMLALLKTLPK